MYYVQPWELHEHLLLRNFGVMIWIDLYTKIYHSDYSAEFVHKHTSFLLNLFYNLYWSWNSTTIDQHCNAEMKINHILIYLAFLFWWQCILFTACFEFYSHELQAMNIFLSLISYCRFVQKIKVAAFRNKHSLCLFNKTF